jgi:hypothetical protein
MEAPRFGKPGKHYAKQVVGEILSRVHRAS